MAIIRFCRHEACEASGIAIQILPMSSVDTAAEVWTHSDTVASVDIAVSSFAIKQK